MKVEKMRYFIFAVVLVLIIVTILYIDNNDIQVSHYTITSNKIPGSFKGFKIIQLSDLHSKTFGNKNSKLIKKIKSENPDIVVMTGDMINTNDTAFEVFFNLAEQLGKNYDTYYVVGNNEQNLRGGKLKLFTDRLKSIGIRVLDNEKVIITRDNKNINLYGLWVCTKYYEGSSCKSPGRYFSAEQNVTILGNLDNNSYNILLTHNPLYIDSYSSWGADLTLSGHMHGGMIRIPFVGGLLSPERTIFPKYDAGRYQVNGKVLIVNRGLGNGSFGIRIFNPPEISVITLSD